MIMVSPVGGFGWVHTEGDDADYAVGYGESFIEDRGGAQRRSYQCNPLGYRKGFSEIDDLVWSTMATHIRSGLGKERV
jgi:hypothetical protein